MQEVFDYLKECGIFYLATVDGDKPRIRPIGALMVYNDKLYIQTGKIKEMSKQMAANPDIEICACRNGSSWIRVRGRAISDDSVAAKKALLDLYPELRSIYDENDDNTEVLFIENVSAAFFEFGKETRIVKF